MKKSAEEEISIYPTIRNRIAPESLSLLEEPTPNLILDTGGTLCYRTIEGR